MCARAWSARQRFGCQPARRRSRRTRCPIAPTAWRLSWTVRTGRCACTPCATSRLPTASASRSNGCRGGHLTRWSIRHGLSRNRPRHYKREPPPPSAPSASASYAYMYCPLEWEHGTHTHTCVCEIANERKTRHTVQWRLARGTELRGQ